MDGKLITGEIIQQLSPGVIHRPFNYNIETGEKTVIQTTGYMGVFTTSDGVIFLVSPSPTTTPDHETSVSVKGATPIPVEQWLQEEHNLRDVPSGLTSVDISSDGFHFTGYWGTEWVSFMISL